MLINLIFIFNKFILGKAANINIIFGSESNKVETLDKIARIQLYDEGFNGRVNYRMTPQFPRRLSAFWRIPVAEVCGSYCRFCHFVPIPQNFQK